LCVHRDFEFGDRPACAIARKQQRSAERLGYGTYASEWFRIGCVVRDQQNFMPAELSVLHRGQIMSSFGRRLNIQFANQRNYLDELYERERRSKLN
jgi:hypothetical protein